MKEYNGFYKKLKSHGVTMYAVAKAGGWSWQQVAEWTNGKRVPQLATFKQLQRVMLDFGVEIDVDDFGNGTRVPQIATFKQLQRVLMDFGVEIDVDDFGKGGEK